MKEDKKNCDDFLIPPDIDKFLQKCVKSIVKKEDFVVHEAIITPVMKGGGYMAISYTIDIKGRTSEDEKEVHVFVKKAIPESTMDSVFSMKTAYLNECFIYKELAKLFQKFQDDAGVLKEERFKMIKGFEESTPEAIVLENVSHQGFKMWKRMELASVQFLEHALVQLAKFHALGFVLQKKMPDYFDKNVRPKEFPFKFNELWNAIAKQLLNISIKNLRPEFKRKAEDFIPVFFREFGKYHKDKSSMCTICHGDFWTNNILFREVEGDIAELIMIDYQTIYYGCPVNDVLQIIYGCTDKKIRDNHKNRLISLYYQTLSDFLKYFDLNVSEVYPREEFDKAIEKRADFGIMLALYSYPVFYAADNDIVDIQDDLTTVDYNLHPEVVRRIEEIVEEYYENKKEV